MNERSHPTVITLGETMVLVTPASAEALDVATDFHLDVGGAESNVASHLAALGHRAAWVSQVGDDALGHRLESQIRERGVDTRWVRIDPLAPTGVYFKNPGRGVQYFRRGSAASTMSAATLDGLPLEQARLVHVSGITPALSSSCADLIDALLQRISGTDTLVSFDVNYRPALWPVDEAAPRVLAIAQRADVVFVGLDEAQTLWGTETPEQVRALIATPHTLVVKDGDIGATSFSANERTFVPATPTDVVEAVGAGDAFAAGYLSALLNGHDATERLSAGHKRAVLVLGSMTDFTPTSAVAIPVTSDTSDTSATSAGSAGSAVSARSRKALPMTDISNDTLDELFAGQRLMAILRGFGAERSVELAETAWDLGIDCVEVPIQSERDIEALRAVVDAGALRGKAVGAGTVVTLDHVRQAAEAGAAFTVSPGFDLDVVRASCAAGMPPLPGVATASEVQAASTAGLTWLKAFPASLYGTEWFSAMKGPFPGINFVATGGMDASNAEDFLAHGVRVVAVGSALADPEQLPRLAAIVGGI